MPVLRNTPEQKAPPPKIHEQKQVPKQTGFLSGMANDDIILLVVFLILIMDNCDDRLLLLALGFIFFSDYFT